MINLQTTFSNDEEKQVKTALQKMVNKATPKQLINLGKLADIYSQKELNKLFEQLESIV